MYDSCLKNENKTRLGQCDIIKPSMSLMISVCVTRERLRDGTKKPCLKNGIDA